MVFGMLSGVTLINYSTMLWVYLGIRLFLSLAFIIGIIYFGARLRRKTFTTDTQPQKSKFVSLGIGWSPRKEERRITAERRGKQTVYIAGMTLALILGVAIGRESLKLQLAEGTTSVPDALVITVNADGSNYMLAPDGRTFNASFCPDDHGNVDHSLIRGNKLKEFKFKQRANCKEIYGYGLGYRPYTENGVRTIFPIPEEIANAR